MNRNELYQKAENIINERQQLAKISADKRRSEVYKKIPIIKQYEKSLANDMVDLTRLVLKKQKDSTNLLYEIRDRNLNTQSKIKAELIKNGYPENYLEVDYTCKLCSDTGVYNGERCTCVKKIIKKISTEDFNKTTGIKLCDFEDFDIKYYSNIDMSFGNVTDRERMSSVYRFCYQYADTFSHKSTNILMLGNTGLGKTHLSLSIAKKVIEKGYTVVYGSAQDYFSTIQNENFGKVKSNDTMNLIKSADLFILDDLGSEYISSSNSSVLYNIINGRINFERPTIINTNLDVTQIIKRYGDRIVSRLIGEYTSLQFVGKDIRQLKIKR